MESSLCRLNHCPNIEKSSRYIMPPTMHECGSSCPHGSLTDTINKGKGSRDIEKGGERKAGRRRKGWPPGSQAAQPSPHPTGLGWSFQDPLTTSNAVLSCCSLPLGKQGFCLPSTGALSAVPSKARSGYRMPWSWSHRWLRATWGLGTELSTLQF